MASRKTSRKTRTMRPVRRKKVEHRDDPSLRHRETAEDRRFGSENKNLAHLRFQALAHSLHMRPTSEHSTTPTTAGGSNWIQLGPMAVPKGQTYGGARVLVSGRVTAILPHPTDPATIYVAAARGGIWKSIDGGITWTPTSDNAITLGIGALAMAASSPQTMYAGTGEGNAYYYVQNFPLGAATESYWGNGILKTVDGGNTWVVQGELTFAGASFYAIAVDPTDPQRVYVATNLGLHRSTDGGSTWVQMTNGLPTISTSIIAATDVVIDPSTPATVYVAFWGDGIYRTTNGGAGNPSWTKLTTGLPTSNISRISLGVSASSPDKVYALMADAADAFKGVYETVAGTGGSSWQIISAAAGVVEMYGAYTNKISVDYSTPDAIYVSGVELYRGIRNAATGVWSFSNIGGGIHPDNHAFAFHPTDHQTIYAGSDGGIYRSIDQGATWDDSINSGLCLAQFEFIDQHPTSDAVVLGGTQDNGTEQFRNSAVFYHSADGDGGFAAIDQSNPLTAFHEYYVASPERSTQGGKFGTWSPIDSGISGSPIFYPPYAFDAANPNNMAFGTTLINLDPAQGTSGWPTKVALPGISGRVSAINYINSALIYCGTTSGQVYRLVKSGTAWTATAIQAAPLPSRWIWDVAPLPTDNNTVVVVMAGFGAAHVWRGVVAAGGATWTDISGSSPDRLPDIPVNALVIDPANANTMYVGTDIGVFRTVDAGLNWTLFNDGLPNTAVYDLKLHVPTRLLRAATHGRGIWERKIDVASMPDVDIFLRDHLMDTGRGPSSSPQIAAFEDLTQHVSLGDQLWWWECPDVKIDTPVSGVYQKDVSGVDYVYFESELMHRDPQRGRVNRVYVELHNRGIAAVSNVTVKIIYADATGGLPPLPADFWTAFPGDSADTSNWKPIGSAQAVASILPTQPVVVEFDWSTPLTAADNSCIFVVTDCVENPIPVSNKVLNVDVLVPNEKHVGLKNLHVINAVAPKPKPVWTRMLLSSGELGRETLHVLPQSANGWSFGLVLPPAIETKIKAEGMSKVKVPLQVQKSFLLRDRNDKSLTPPKTMLLVKDLRKGATIAGLPPSRKPVIGFLAFIPGTKTTSASVKVVQRSGERVVGGNTFALRVGSEG